MIKAQLKTVSCRFKTSLRLASQGVSSKPTAFTLTETIRFKAALLYLTAKKESASRSCEATFARSVFKKLLALLA